MIYCFVRNNAQKLIAKIGPYAFAELRNVNDISKVYCHVGTPRSGVRYKNLLIHLYNLMVELYKRIAGRKAAAPEPFDYQKIPSVDEIITPDGSRLKVVPAGEIEEALPKDKSDFPLDVLAIVAECADTETEKCVFISFVETLLDDEIYRYEIGTEQDCENIKKNPLIARIINEFSHKREEDFEQWALDYGMISVKKEMETDDRMNHNSNHKKTINILQLYLEKLNYEGKRVPESKVENRSLGIVL